MRSETEMFDLILSTAQEDERIRAVILNGSRANPNASRDRWQDFDIVYVVTEVAPFRSQPEWIARFGAPMIVQMPDLMGDGPLPDDRFAYLMQFIDGNRIDLTLMTREAFGRAPVDSLSVLLLDKEDALPAFAPASEADYLPKPPTARAYAECCNEFWWVSVYVAKGLWRGQLTYAKAMLENVVREEAIRMLTWQLGAQTGFTVNVGAHGKHFERLMSPDQSARWAATYADADPDHTWAALFALCDLFRSSAQAVAARFGFDYPQPDDARVSAYLRANTRR